MSDIAVCLFGVACFTKCKIQVIPSVGDGGLQLFILWARGSIAVATLALSGIRVQWIRVEGGIGVQSEAEFRSPSLGLWRAGALEGVRVEALRVGLSASRFEVAALEESVEGSGMR